MREETKPKDKLFETAARLFYQHGYRAIGVDTLAAESGIGKMTLYRHYPSKDELILAYLRDSDDNFWNHFETITKDLPSAREKLLSFFRSLQDYVISPACYGCPFNNVATEFPEPGYAGHQVALEHKQKVRTWFMQLAQETGASQPKALADGLFLLMDGAYMAARMFGSSTDNPAADLAEAARCLIDSYCKA
jgi:AcrR family transcriptional regulator